VQLHVHEWGDPAAPPLVCLHGVTGHGRRFRRLAEERLASRFHVLAPDLRGHGRSSWDPPWSNPAHVQDLRDTAAALDVERAAWMGHSWGGRLVLELAAAAPELVERAVLLDPAIHPLAHVSRDLAEHERVQPSFDSFDEAVAARIEANPTNPRDAVEEDAREHFEVGPDGRLRRRCLQAAIVTIYGDCAGAPPPPETLRAPTLLLYAPAYGLVRDEQIAAYREALGDRLEVVEVSGGHMVFWDAFDETADAVERFLAS
jgi:lipase